MVNIEVAHTHTHMSIERHVEKERKSKIHRFIFTLVDVLIPEIGISSSRFCLRVGMNVRQI